MTGQLELWSNLATVDSRNPEIVVRRAQRLEADGWDGATLVDSQCLRADVFVCLTWCALSTTTLKLGTGTSNPATRHPAVNASAAAALQLVSKGRMTYGIGRGDSALAYIGAPPVPVGYFERAIAMIQSYLRGEGVPIAEAASMLGGLPTGFDHLAVNAAPEQSYLKWLDGDMIRPPLEVSATGPKVIAAAARHADRIAFAVGGDIARLKWAIGLAREEIAKAGRDPSQVALGAFIPLYPHADLEISRKLAQGMVASQGRFAIINKKVAGPVSEAQRAVLERVAGSYDMTNHGQGASKQVQALDTDFIDTFALVGDPARCLDRLLEIKALGLSRLHLWTAATETEAGAQSYQMAADKILPQLAASRA